jgi:dienelactone hydrolase
MPLRSLPIAICVALLGTLGASAGEPLSGTQPLTIAGPLDEVMVSGIDKFALRELEASVARRADLWHRDYSSPEAYAKSVAANREHLQTILGVVDARAAAAGLELIATTDQDSVVAKGSLYTVHAVRWPVLAGVTAEGLLLQPAGKPVARVVAIPDADWTPEMFAGVASGVDPSAQLARRLAEQGCQVLVPMLISRDDTLSGNPLVRYTNQPHREFIYRQAFEMGRHIIGYEIQKVLAAIDQFTRLNETQKTDLPLGVAGVGEGGLLALSSGALDSRIDSVLVSGYFQTREGLWEEPIYRNVWSLLREFGDAELASLIAPRSLTIEASAAPEISGPPAPKPGRSGGAAPGKITIPTLAAVRKEYDRAREFYTQLKQPEKLVFVSSREGDGPAGSDAALAGFSTGLGFKLATVKAAPQASGLPQDLRVGFDPNARQKRQFDELVEFTQTLLRRSAKVRDTLWAKADRSSLAAWEKTAEPYRNLVWEELIGKLPHPSMPPNVRTRQVLDEPGYRGYEVVIDVYPDVIAAGILLLPKDLKGNEKRPVVVCQHGLEGVPMDTISRDGQGFQYYSAFAHELANRGFITYAPQNPYRGQDRFRTLQRKSNPLKRSLFSYIIPQHERTLEWLATLPNVDPQRMAFYGLSYGGKTAVRVPPMLTKYCLSICSADYNEWVVKNTTVEDRYSYVFTPEYEIFEWNMGHLANYSELANLMTPRPFMVERGHNDGVAPDEWVAWEYSKVRRHYAFVGLPEKTEIEFFNGPHKINGMATYDFLHKHLNWPKRPVAAAASK